MLITFIMFLVFIKVDSSSVPTCTNTDGTVVNEAACKCGTTDCTSSTGLFCTSSVNRCLPYSIPNIWSGKITGLIPQKRYKISWKVLQSGLGTNDKYLDSVALNGVTYNNNCQGGSDDACEFVSCFP